MMIMASIANISGKYFVSCCIGYHCFRSKELRLRLDSFSNSTRDVEIDLGCLHRSVILENNNHHHHLHDDKNNHHHQKEI